jgi:hypothetical protein
MDINQIRFQNYRTLMAQFRAAELDRGEPERGLLNRFGKRTGISPRYLSHVNNARKHLGGDTCRRMEQSFKLPHGWMDHDHLAGPASSTRAEREYIELALKLFRESPVEAQAVLLRYMGDRMMRPEASSKAKKHEGKNEVVVPAVSLAARAAKQRKRRAAH